MLRLLPALARFFCFRIAPSVISFLFILLLASPPALAQSPLRISDHNAISWGQISGIIQKGKHWGLYADVQTRRMDFFGRPQQNAAKAAFNYKWDSAVTLRAGYGFTYTYNFSEHPPQANGREYPEHRIFEAIQITDAHMFVDKQFRLTLEHRWVGKYLDPAAPQPDHWPLTHRLRYQTRLSIPLKGYQISKKTPYITAWDEIFIGLGKNVGYNVFDQNRLAGGFGYVFDKGLKAELVALSQIVQLGRQQAGKSIFHYNTGALLNITWQVNVK